MPDQDTHQNDGFDVEKLDLIVEWQQKDEIEILQSLGFDWRHSPRIDHGVISCHPVSGPVTLEFTLPTGRLIRLDSLYQYNVYGGMFCGMPNDPRWHFIEAVNVAKQHFPNHEMMPVMLEPVFHVGQVLRKQHDHTEFRVHWLKLPEVCTVAVFDSNEPARNDYEVYSSVLAIWFQDHYGLPDDARTLEQLGNLDWEKNGHDWTP